MSTQEKIIAQKMAKALAFLCLNDHFKEPLHNGKIPVTKNGDFSDVFIIDADGEHMIWHQTCRISYDERESMIAEVANGIYDFLINVETDVYSNKLENAYRASAHWKAPSLKSTPKDESKTQKIKEKTKKKA